MSADLLLGEEVDQNPQDAALHVCVAQKEHLTFQTAEVSSSHLAGERQNKDGLRIQRGYCRDLLTNDGVELCFEEVRAQVFRKRQQKRLDEKRQCLREERLQLELQVARMSSLLKWPAHQSSSCRILEDPALSPRPSCSTLEAELCATDAARLEGCASSSESAQLGNCSGDLTQDQEVLGHAQVSCSPPDGGAVLEADPRRQLLERCDITSCANFHLEARPLPDFGEHTSVWLGGEHYQTRCRLLEASGALAYEGWRDNRSVIIKVDRCPLAWDFYMFGRLTANSSAADLPLVRCYQFQDGCVTVYVAPPSHVFTELSERVLSEDSAVEVARSLLNLTSAMHAGGLVHAALRPDVLVCCHPAGASAQSNWLFPLDWRAAAETREGVVALKRQSAASADAELVRVGLLDADAPPQLVDLVGVAQMLHLLLTKRKMVPVRDAAGWTAEGFQRVTPGASTSALWCHVFRSLLNADADSWVAVTSQLLETLAASHR